LNHSEDSSKLLEKDPFEQSLQEDDLPVKEPKQKSSKNIFFGVE